MAALSVNGLNWLLISLGYEYLSQKMMTLVTPHVSSQYYQRLMRERRSTSSR